MPNVTIPNAFSANTLIQSAAVNANFTALANYCNSGSGSFAASGYAVLPGGIVLQWGSSSTDAGLGGETTVSFPEAFPTNVFQVVASVDNATLTNPWVLSAQTNALTTSGFKLNVTGGPTGNNVTVRWFAIGN